MAMAAVAVGAVVVGAAVKSHGARTAASAKRRAYRSAGQKTEEEFQLSKTALGDAQSRFSDAQTSIQEDQYQPYSEAGRRAFDMEQAYSGALGAEKQKAAFDAYQESPGVQFAKEQGMMGIRQDSGASGVGGGTRMKAIGEFLQGTAMQDFANQYGRLSNLGRVGMQADQSIANSRNATATADVSTQNRIANMRAAAAGQKAGFIVDAGTATASGILGNAGAWAGAAESIGTMASGGMGGGGGRQAGGTNTMNYSSGMRYA